MLLSFTRNLFIKRTSRSFNFRYFSSEPIKTALYDEHISLQGKMIDFAGYALPITYSDGIVSSHKHCRTNASIFDVSHMGQIIFTGDNVNKYLEKVTVADLKVLNNNQGRLSSILNYDGNMLDDCIINKINDNEYYMIVNGM